MTQEVQDYILDYRHNGVPYEIHLIDSPGFDDGALADIQVLSRIALYVNTNYRLKHKLAGVLYLHDITKPRMGGVALKNLRMLQEMIGNEGYGNCTLVTTKWGCTTTPQDEVEHEKTLEREDRYFGSMLRSPQPAKMKRFDPKTRKTALDIITPYLNNQFTLQISRQMADPDGPKLALGETKAGMVIADNLEKLAQSKEELAKAQKTLLEKHDEDLFAEFKHKRKMLRRKIILHRSERWIMRTTIVGGAIVATILTLGPGASAFVLEPMYEKAVKGQKKKDKKAKEDLKAELVKKTQNGSRFKETDPEWLFDTHVKQLQDLELYSLKSGGSVSDILKVAQQGKVVRSAASESSEAVDSAMSENSEWSESDAEILESDLEKV